MKDLDDLLSIWEQRKEVGDTISAAELCRENPELLDDVRWHIRALESIDAKFGKMDTRQRQTTPGWQSTNRSLPNREFEITNRYQIERHHASGGLGDVYLAIDPILDRKVAIKFPRKSRLTPEQVARFEREARITGQLDHPGIVAVHSLKIADNSQPCYVMRFVQGPTFQERAKEFHASQEKRNSRGPFNSMEFRELLQHFVALCNIVGYAHNQGVVHRDIKPSNVILGPFGQTYLMDWGLARTDRVDSGNSGGAGSAPDKPAGRSSEESGEAELPLGTPAAGEAFSTRTGQVMGTPAFASPEQLLGLTVQVDQRSDVYSLGASLYFVLTGRVPIDIADSKEYLERIGIEKESLLKFPSSIPSPLAAICRTATHVSPALRYPSALALAQDIQSFLASESISVLSDSWGTKAWRWIGKNRATSLTACLAAMLLLMVCGIGLAVLSTNYQKLEQSAIAERESRVKAERNFATAREAIQEFFVRTSENEKLKQMAFTDLREELLDSAVPFYERLRQQEPGDDTVENLRGDALYRLSSIQIEKGDLESALASLSDCRKTYQKLVEQNPSDVQFKNSLARCQHELGKLLLDLGNPAQSKIEFDAARENFETLVKNNPEEPEYQSGLASTYIRLAFVANSENDRVGKKIRYRKAYEIMESLAERFPDNPEYLSKFSLTGSSVANLMSQLEIDKAIEYYERGIQITSDLASKFPMDPRYRHSTSIQRIELARRLIDLERQEEAREICETALTSLGKLVEEFPAVPKYQHDLGKCLSVLGTYHSRNGNFEESRVTLLRAQSVFSNLSSSFPFNPTYRFDEMLSIRGLAGVMLNLNDPSARRTYCERALVLQEALVQEHPDVPEYLRWLARNNRTLAAMDHENRERKGAEKYFRAAFEAGTRLAKLVPDVPDDTFNLANCQVNLAILLGQRGAKDESLKNWQEGLKLSQRLVDQHPENTRYRFELAVFLWEFGKTQSLEDSLSYFQKSEMEFKTVMAKYPADLISNSRYMTNVYHSYAYSLFRLKRYRESIAAYESALKFHDASNKKLTKRLQKELAEVRTMMEEGDRWDEYLATGESPKTNSEQVRFIDHCLLRMQLIRAARESMKLLDFSGLK